MQKGSRFTKIEKSWIMYDWANSVYATNMLAAIFPIYFAEVCKQSGADNLVLWAYGTSISTFTVALLAPILGSLGDHRGAKKKLFAAFLVLGVLFTLSNAFFTDYRSLLIGYILSHIGFSGSCLFYDAFITDVTTPDRMDKISSWGFAMGYIGGSTIPFLISIGVLILMGMENPEAFKVVIIITSLWWLIFSIPMLKNVRQVHYVEVGAGNLIKSSFKNLARTAKDIVSNKAIFFFVVAYFFYIDGVNTIISTATAYGAKLGLDSIYMILALLLTQLVAVPFSILFGKLVPKFGSIKMLIFAIYVYVFICILGFFMGFILEQFHAEDVIHISQALFWILAFFVGTVQGGIQAISRSHFGKIIPSERSNEFFGFFDIFGRFAAVIGPLLVGLITNITGRDSLGIISLIILFGVGLVILSTKRKLLAIEPRE